MENDYSLLRPFDEEKAKAGEAICFAGSRKVVLYIAGPDKAANIVCDVDGYLRDYFHTALRLAPLCWVEGKPVYKGDVVYPKTPCDWRGTAEAVRKFGGWEFLVFSGDESGIRSDQWNSLTLDKPAKKTIELKKHEIQSGLDRVKWAEGLIRQLPENHDGRNSWLMNYGTGVTQKPAAPSEFDRLSKIIQDGRDARDSGAPCPYAARTIEWLLHGSGWVQRDLRLALDAEREGNRKLSASLAKATDFIANNGVSLWRIDTTGKMQGFINVYPSARGYRGDSPARIDGLYASRTDADCFAGSDRVDCVEVWFNPPARPQ